MTLNKVYQQNTAQSRQFTPTNPDTNYAGTQQPVKHSMADNLNGLLSRSNPLVQMSLTRAAQEANKRGLLNSSLAAEAGEEAALRVMLPVAEIDAKLADGRQRLGMELDNRKKLSYQEGAITAGANADQIYGNMFNNIMNLTNIDAGTRAQYLKHADVLRQNHVNWAQQVYGTNLNWTSATL